MSQKILGIDLGTSSVKVLLIERKIQDLQILEFIDEPLNLQSRLSHEEQVVVILEKILSTHVLDADVICMSFPGHLTSSRIVTLPFTNAKKISQLVDFELESFIPFPIEEIFSDYHILNQSANESQLLCAYTQEESLKKYIEKLSAANIEAKYLGPTLTDLAGIAHVAMVPTEGYYAICDIGHSGTNLLIMEGKELKYIRAIGIGGYHFTRAIQRAFNLNQEKAEALKLSRGKLHVRAQDSDQISRILNKVAMELVSSIKQTFWGLGHFYKNANVMAIYCCGGGSRLDGMFEFMSFHLRLNVFELESLNFVGHHFEDPEQVNAIIPQVLATAIRPTHSHRVPRINFRKGLYAYKQDLQAITSEFKSVGILLLVIFLMGIGYYFYANHYYAHKMASIDKRVEAILKDYSELREKGKKGRSTQSLKGYLKSAQGKLKELKSSAPALMQDEENIVDVMYEISRSLPPKSEVNFEVRKLNYKDDFVRLDASTNDPLNVDKIVLALEKSERFSNVQRPDTEPKPGGIWYFTLKLALKDEEAAP